MSARKKQEEKGVRQNMITQSTVIDKGFTKAMIKKLLPSPIERPNPNYKKAAPMKLYVESDVLKVMETDEYKEEWEKAQKRKTSALKAVETKKENLKKEMQEIGESIEVINLPKAELIEKALKNHETYLIERYERELEYLENRRDKYEEYCEISKELDYLKNFGLRKPSEEAMQRIIVNYIRHELTTYDYELGMLEKRIGKDEAYRVLKKAILRKIALEYPDYKTECESQIQTI